MEMLMPIRWVTCEMAMQVVDMGSSTPVQPDMGVLSENRAPHLCAVTEVSVRVRLEGLEAELGRKAVICAIVISWWRVVNQAD